jgi:signal transduction histidine kinase
VEATRDARADSLREPAIELARAIAAYAGLDWLCLPDGDGEWTEIRGRGSRWRRSEARPARCIEFGALRSLPSDRLVRVDEAALGRSPRWAAADLREVFLFRDARKLDAPAVLGLRRPMAAETSHLETLLRSWFAVGVARERVRQDEEEVRWDRIGRQTACLAHDLRHGLTLVGLELDRCAAEAVGESRVSEGIARARAELRATAEVCEGGLGRTEVRDPGTSFLAVEVLRDVVRRAHAISGARARVELRCAADLEMRTDRVILGRLVQNLVLNALEASPADAVVALEVARSPVGDVTIAVRDSGRGMPRAELAGLLRLGRSGGGGSGIGTASAEDCARALGSSLEFRSRLGRGTEVRFRIR